MDLSLREQNALIVAAAQARQRAYAPYSRFAVGAAVVDEQERVFTGANVENASYGLSFCAERAAISAAVGAGAKRILAVVVVGDCTEPITPCGACRQWIAEFADDDCPVIGANLAGEVRHSTLGGLLPGAFRIS